MDKTMSNEKSTRSIGLDSLEDHLADDICVLQHLIEWTRDETLEDKERFDFTQELNHVIKSVNELYCSPKNTVFVSSLIRQCRALISLVAETLYIQISFHICKLASESVIRVPTKIKYQIFELHQRLNNIQKLVISLYPLNGTNSHTSGFMQNGYGRFMGADAESVNWTVKSKQIQDLLEGCEMMLCVIVDAVEDKCCRDSTFYNAMSISIGAVCAGRFAWKLWNADCVEELLNTGVWSLCTGLSAVVLQVPRVRRSCILRQLEQQRRKRKKTERLTKNWRMSNAWSYSKLIKTPSSRTAA